MRLTIACPEAHIGDANNLAMVLAEGPDDARTYGAPGWQDADGNRYAACSFVAGDGFTGRAFGTLSRPAWDTSRHVNMTGAGRAQALVRLAQPGDLASPDTILAMPGDNAPAALAAMGLTLIPTDPEP